MNVAAEHDQPGLSNITGAAPCGVELAVNTFAGENEYTEWRMLSLFGKRTAVPVRMTLTRGTNVLLT